MHHPGLSQAIRRLPALVLALVFVFSFARAGSAQNEVYLPQDDHFESLLAEAMRRNAEQRPGEAARAITLAEDRLEELVAEGNALPMTRGEEGVYLAARTEIARILLSGGPELLAAYRAARAPYIEALLTEGGEVRDAVKLREVLSRYPLATGDARAPARLADLLLESGALAEAARSYEDARQSTDDPLAQARFDKALAWIRSKRQAGRATTGWPTEGGGPGRGQAADPSVIPGEPAFTVQVPSTEVTERVKAGYARRHLPIPRVFHPVTDGQALFVQDSKVVCAIDPASAKLRWLYVASDPQDARTEEPLLPGQLANPAFRPTLDQGHVYATLDRNTPPIYDPEAPMAEKGQQQTAERARDWRVVCLDAKSGRLRWDAAESEGLVELLRGARHVSPPLVAHGQVYLVVLTEKAGDLSAYAVALDAATGALNFQAFVASRSPSDFLRQAAIAPAPTAAQGRIILQTGLSLIAAVDPHTGATAWANAFPTPPLENEQRIVERGHRFALTSPRLVGEVLIVAPQSSVALLGLDPATGRSVFRVSRGPLTHLCGTTAEGFVLAGSDRRGGTIVQGYDARNGRTRWQTRIREGRLAGHPFATREHVYVPTGDAVTTLSAQTGRPVASAITLSRGASQSGNILATPFGIVLTHASGLTVLEDRAASRERLERAYRAQPSPEAALTWGSFLGRTGELDAALNVLDAGRAGVGAGSDAARALEEAAYDLARREARRLDADGQNEAALTAWIRASRYAGDLPRAAGDLAALAQKLVDSARLQDAATVLGRLSGLGDASLTIESASEHVLARTWARLRLQELRATDGGPEALAAFDREAAEALAAIRGQLSPEPLQSLAERYPTSPAEADALLLTADLFERQGLPNVAAQYLRDRLNRFPERRDTKDLLLRRARLLERTLRYTEAVADYRLLRDHFGSARVMDDPRELSELADERLRALAPLVSDPSFQTPTGAGDELGLVFQTRTDLENTDPVVFSPAGLDPETARVFLVLGEQSLEGRLVETGLVKWRLKFTEPPRKEHVVAADPSTIVLYADSTLLALDLTSGEIRWRAALDEIAPPPAAELTPPPGEGEEPSEDELEPEEDVDDLARPDRFRGIAARAGHLVCTISDGAFALEAATGKLRWRKEGIEDLGPFTQITPLEGGRHTVVLAQEVPATLIGLDLASGAERYRTLLGEGEPRLSLGPTPTEGAWTFVVTSGPRLSACDVVTGRVLWAKRVPYWPRKIFGEPYGQAVAVLPFGGSPNQPKLSVFDGRTGATLYEERTERSAVTAARLTGDTLYLLAGDYMSTRVHAIDWRKGGRQWSFSPPPGHGFEEITISQSHLVLPKSGPAGAGMIYLVGRSRGSLYRTLELARRRAVSVALVGGTLVIGTNRGLLGYKRVDRGRLLEQQAEVTQELSRDPGNARLRAFLADRRFKAGDIDGAIITLRKALELEDMARSVYASMYEQLEGYLEAREPDLVVDVYRATEPPEIDGELWDAWPIEQSFRLSSVGPITTVQGLEGADAVLKGDDDLAGTLYVAYDDRYFYFALDVTDSTLIPYDSEDETWQGDCLLMAIDPKGNGGDYFMRDDILLSLALALPKKNKQDPGEEEEEEDDEPEGKFFVKRKDDRSGAVYEAAIPWASFADRQAEIDPVLGPKAGFQFGLNLILTDDDDGSGARKVLQLAPAVNLHRVKQRLWQGLVPGRFLKVRLQ